MSDTSCPNCDSPNIQQVTASDEEGVAEYRCNECGEYFTAPGHID